MRENIESLLERIKLPPLSFDLLNQLGDDNCDLDSVAESISLDPNLTASLLRICNNAVFGSSEPVSTVAEAINRAGFKSVYMLAAAIYGNGCFGGFAVSRLDSQRLWQHSVAAAFTTKLVAESAGLDANALFTAGLLHDIGKVILAQSRSQETCNFYGPSDAAALQQEALIYGLDHAEVGALLLEKWKLPLPLIDAVRFHHDPRKSGRFETFVAGVTLGNAVSHGMENPAALESNTCLYALKLLRLTPDHLQLWREQYGESQPLVSNLSSLAV